MSEIRPVKAISKKGRESVISDNSKLLKPFIHFESLVYRNSGRGEARKMSGNNRNIQDLSPAR